MNTEPTKTPRKENPLRARVENWMDSKAGRVLKAVLKNWPWKLLAFFLAICLWAGLITQDPTLTRERVFNDVTLSVSGAETMRRSNGLIVLSGLEEENLNVRMRVEVPQREYNTVTAANYNPRVELSRITEPGEQTLRVAATSTTSYGIVEDIYPATIDVVVDRYVTNYRVPVTVNLTGEYPDGFYADALSLDPSTVAVSGPETIVDQIARVMVDYDVSLLKAEAGERVSALPIRFVTREGETIESEQLEASSASVVLRTITVKQTLYPTRVLPLSGNALIEGQPAHGYRVASVSVSPTELTVAASQEVLDAMGNMVLESPVDVNGVSESFDETVRVRRPAELEHISSGSLTVSVEIEPVIVRRVFDSVKLFARGMGSGLRASMDVSTLSMMVTGPQLQVESLRNADVTAYVDTSGLTAGTHVLPVQFLATGTDMTDLSFVATPATVTVTLAEN